MFQLDPGTKVPIYEQIFNNVVKMTSLGVIKPGDKLPPVRALAEQLGINPNTVAKAYRDLENAGYIYSAVGRGSFVSEAATKSRAQRQLAEENFADAARNALNLGVSREELLKIIDKVTG